MLFYMTLLFDDGKNFDSLRSDKYWKRLRGGLF